MEPSGTPDVFVTRVVSSPQAGASGSQEHSHEGIQARHRFPSQPTHFGVLNDRLQVVLAERDEESQAHFASFPSCSGDTASGLLALSEGQGGPGGFEKLKGRAGRALPGRRCWRPPGVSCGLAVGGADRMQCFCERVAFQVAFTVRV